MASETMDGTVATAESELGQMAGPLVSSGSDATPADMRETPDKQMFDGLTLEFGLQVLPCAPLGSSGAPERGDTGTKADEGGTLIKLRTDWGMRETSARQVLDGLTLEFTETLVTSDSTAPVLMQLAGPQEGTQRLA